MRVFRLKTSVRFWRRPASTRPREPSTALFASSTIAANDQILTAKDWSGRIFRVVAYRHGAPVHISDIGDAIDGVENDQIAAWVDQHRGIILGVFRLPGANIISTANLVKAQIPRLRGNLCRRRSTVELLADRTQMICASVADIEETLILTIGLVVMVIFVFLRKIWATVIPGIAGAVVADRARSGQCTCSATASTTCR